MNVHTVRLIFGILLSALFFSNSFVLFVLAYVFISLFMIAYTLLRIDNVKNKIILLLLYLMIMVFQLVYTNTVIFTYNSNLFTTVIAKIIGISIVLIPLFINTIHPGNKRVESYLPSVQDTAVFTFNELIENIDNIADIINKGQKSLSKDNIYELLKYLPRHNSFRYINKESITDEYFESAYQTLTDPNIYIIISNTGSPASEIISMFTRKKYNHASLSFDKELKTIISYNGGEKLYPPGLNMEIIEYFNKKQDSSIIVYSVLLSAENKKMIIDKIKEINSQGNAYNLFGLVFKSSFKPNIMFCSQFVYRMLKIAGLSYFEKQDGQIKPTDLIELDYYRKLSYEYEIKLNEIC
ncbi:MAG: hypothetical protein LBQ77_03290 [Treponema sp.]|nr:hypothetical protein [Treponema sp.]